MNKFPEVLPAGNALPVTLEINAETIITKAIERNVPVEALEKLLAMRRELKAEQAREAYFRALVAFQAECPIIPKTECVRNRDGRSVRYRYAPIEVILRMVGPLVQRHGFSYWMTTEAKLETPLFLVGIVKVQHVEGHAERSEFPVQVESSGRMSAAQESAAAATFAKRNAFCNAFGILTGDEAGGADHDTKPMPERVSETQVRQIEIRIRQGGYDREKVRAWMVERFQGEFQEFADLTPAAYGTFEGQLAHWEKIAQRGKR